MHIVFIVGSYYPNYSAVGKCVGNVADVLARENKVTVICEKSTLDQQDKEIYNNQTILRTITSDKTRRLKVINQINRAKGSKKSIYNILLNILKLQQALKFVFSKTSIKKELVSAYEEILKGIDENIDVIIPSSMPFESVIAAHHFKKNINSEVILLPYLFDKFTDSQTLHRFAFNRLIKRKAHIQLEKEVLSNAKKIIAMHTLRGFYGQYIPGINQILYTEHPLIIPTYVNNSLPSAHIKLAYIGGFYKNYVEPYYLLKLLSNATIDAVCDFYTIGNCKGVLEKFSKKFPSRIINKGSVDKETATRKITENHILISVAERSGSQLSSKIFDYISNGKPIIHFYKSDEDVNCKVLQNYPLALCIKEDEKQLHQNIKIFEDFCTKNYEKYVSLNRVVELYSDALPDYTADLIKRIVNR